METSSNFNLSSHKISVIGLGVNTENLIPGYVDKIMNSQVLVGGRRLLSLFPHYRGIKIEISGDLNEIFNAIKIHKAKQKNIVILASGDPLFFGIGEGILREFPGDEVEIFPNISSIQYVFSKIKEPWQNIPVISLHGEKIKDKYFDIIKNFREKKNKVLILTDKKNSPKEIAFFLMENNLNNTEITVASDLGSDSESIVTYLPRDAIKREFSPLNVVILRNKGQEFFNTTLGLGLDDSEYIHQRGLITKPEIRAIILSKLRLKSGCIFWDIGSGSGALSIEASNFTEPENIYSIEKEKLRIKDIKANFRKFYVNNINIIEGIAPNCLDNLPNPHSVFIGGSDGKIVEIINKTLDKIQENGRIIISVVLIKTFNDLVNYFEKTRLKYDILNISIQKTDILGKSVYFKPYNTCWLFLISLP